MTQLTDKQRAFAVNKAAGVKHREAAIAAGYAPTAAAQQASILMSRPDIKAAIKAAKKLMTNGVMPEGVNIATEAGLDPKKNSMPKSHYADPVTFLEDLMNHQHVPLAVRADAAKQLLPYKHARIGEKGKKETAKDRAELIAGKGKGVMKKNRLAPKDAPRLHLVK